MIDIPIGETFEAFVEWLKSTFQGVFDLFRQILDYSITLLENTLLLNEEVVASSLLFGTVLTLLVGLLGKRLAGLKGFIGAAMIAAVAFTAVESWRLSTLSQSLTVETASAMETDFVALEDSLLALAPENFDQTIALVSEVEESLEAASSDNPDLETTHRDARRALSAIRRARSDDYERVAEQIEGILLAVQEADYSLPAEQETSLRESSGLYASLVLIEESERLQGDFNDVMQGEKEPERLNQILNARTFENLTALFNTSVEYHRAAGNSDVVTTLTAAKGQLLQLNPDKLGWFGPVATSLLLLLIAYLIAGGGITLFSAGGLFLIYAMGLWVPTVESLALVISATAFALVLGVPIGILAAGSKTADNIVRPILDLMQTMPAFVYLIPAVIFFGLGKVPGAMATLIFAMPPAVRLTTLGIRQVPGEVVEAALSFGCTPMQMLIKAQLPIAMQTILAGINQTIMLALSMVVIGGMIGAGGLGGVVLGGITQMKLGLGFEGGLGVVILAIYLDRVTQALGSQSKVSR